jgi:acyl-CoA synthetase (AMP-forming)/AMP-acid ligase II
MSKKVATLPTWFWPEGVPRATGAPPLFLEEALVDKWAEERPEQLAIIAPSKAFTYSTLQNQITRGARVIAKHVCADGERRLLIEAGSRTDALLLLLSALKARCVVHCSSSVDERSIARFNPEVLVTERPIRPGVGAAVLAAEDVLRGSDGDGAAERGEPKSPALALLTEQRSFAFHSHYGLLSGAIALTSFMEMPDGVKILLSADPGSWWGFYSAISALYLGGSVVICEEDDGTAIAQAVRDHHVDAVFLTAEQAMNVTHRLARSERMIFRETCRWLLMSVEGPFPVKQRKALNNLIGRLAPTVYGTAETGPILASHPSWCVDESVGIPLTNAELRPVDPVSREPIEVPWELLEYAAIDVKASHMMIGYDDPEATAERVRRRWFFTGRLAMMDGNGLYYLLP